MKVSVTFTYCSVTALQSQLRLAAIAICTDAAAVCVMLWSISCHVVQAQGTSMQVTDGEQVLQVSNGIKLMTKITATGCSVTAIACAFIAVTPEQPLLATAFALAVYG